MLYNNFMKVLIIQLRQMGDVLLSTPLAQAIKTSKPHYEVHFLTLSSSYDILSGNPYIDKILLLKNGIRGELSILKEVIKQRYDAIIDIQRTGRSKRITLLSFAKLKIAFKKKKDNFYYNRLIEKTTHGYTAFERMDLLKAIGITPKEKYMPKLFYSSGDLENVKRYLDKESIKRFFIVAPTARKKEKMWAAEEFGKLANLITKNTGLQCVVVYGAEKERSIALECSSYTENAHIIKKPFSIKEFAALVKLSSFFIGNDSFPAHVAVSQNAKTAVICGPTSGWFIENENTVLVYKGLSCQPCNNPNACQLNFLCYFSLKHNEVFDKISPLIFSNYP